MNVNRVIRAISIAGTICLFLQEVSASQTSKVRWSPLLKLDSRKDIEQRLAQPFGDVFRVKTKGKEATISNCKDYLQISSQSYEVADPRAAVILHSDATECVAIQMLQSARAPRKVPPKEFEISAETLDVMPPELAPAVSDELIAKAKAADAAGESWKKYIPQAVAKASGDGQVEVLQPGWKTTLTLYARGDFSGSGNEEVLVRADYQAEGGTYGNSKLFLLARRKNTVRLTLVRTVPIL